MQVKAKKNAGPIWGAMILALLAVCPSIGTAEAQKNPPNPNESITIQAVVAEVKEALANVQTKLAKNQLPPLKSVKLTLQTVATGKVGGKISFWVISIGGSIQKETSQKIVLELGPPKAGNPTKISSESFTKALEDSILDAAQGVQGVGTGDTPLQVNSLSVTLGFTVTAEGTAGTKLTLAPVTLDLSGQKDKKVVHTLEVSYGTASTEKDK
jgi:hypothetical protein